ncbi:MAG: aspartyl/asparaginyl beta-hydroxylase domain-containing protein [Alphaproteobacteria bacterium]|nr:aspartyl/asparaginyl beta-hydroxylase domain-containing protein [Alphaproteobacteria bacterium]|tara:strand:- start:497 stop:1651 length:1155 start_codon:yes stop_codon:yes gene_type:complete
MDAKLQQARNIARQGMQALSARQGAAAEAAFGQAIELGWPGADIWILLSHARSLNKDITGTEAALQKALSLEPENPRALLYMGSFLESCSQHLRARSFYEQGISFAVALQDQTPELADLMSRARRFLANMPKDVRHPVDDFIDVHKLGSDPEDELLIQSLQILAERKRPFVSQPSRFLYAGLPNRQFFRRDEFEWSGALESQTDTIRSELEGLLARPEASRFAPYVESNSQKGAPNDTPMTNNPDWSAFYLMKQGKRVEENIALCPKTMAAIEAIGDDAFPSPQPSVLFSQLKPGTRIPAHVGMFNTRLICHLPLIIPEKCGFRVGNETREWTPGAMFIFDDSINHEAWNESAEPRFILIFEIWRPELSARQRHLLTELFAPGF